jgi:hypothetical protein
MSLLQYGAARCGSNGRASARTAENTLDARHMSCPGRTTGCPVTTLNDEHRALAVADRDETHPALMKWKDVISPLPEHHMKWKHVRSPLRERRTKWSDVLFPLREDGMKWKEAPLPLREDGMKWEEALFPVQEDRMKWKAVLFPLRDDRTKWRDVRIPLRENRMKWKAVLLSLRASLEKEEAVVPTRKDDRVWNSKRNSLVSRGRRPSGERRAPPCARRRQAAH